MKHSFRTPSYLRVRIGIRVGTKISDRFDANIIYECNPLRRQFDAYEDLEKFVRELAKPRLLSGLTVYFKQPWHFNIGHALFDGLYPGYMALTRFPPKHLLPFRSLIDIDTHTCQDCWSEDITSRFGGLGIIKEKILRAASARNWFVFDELVMGNGDMCLHCIQCNYQLLGGVEHDGLRAFRDRMYKQHGLVLPTSREKNSAEKRNKITPLKAFVIHNKRFTTEEQNEINSVINVINNHTRESLLSGNVPTSKRRWPLINISYLNYRSVKGNYIGLAQFNATKIDSRLPTYELLENDFAAQLKILGDMDIYITGPGTAQMYQSFLSDGSVIINLGGLKTVPYRNPPVKYASYMEQFVTAGTPYIKGLYYPINERRKSIKQTLLLEIIIKAAQLIMEGFSIPVNPYDNLAPDGQLFVELCAKDPLFCQSVTERTPEHETTCFHLWVEDMVHEQRQWAPGGFLHGMRNVTCPLNHTLLRALRLKHHIQHGTI